MPIFTKRKFKKASVGSTFIAIAMVVTAGASTPLAAQVASALPNVCTQPLSATNMQGVANFIWAGCPQRLKWPHDTASRMCAPIQMVLATRKFARCPLFRFALSARR
jgi:hypothetical protein